MKHRFSLLTFWIIISTNIIYADCLVDSSQEIVSSLKNSELFGEQNQFIGTSISDVLGTVKKEKLKFDSVKNNARIG